MSLKSRAWSLAIRINRRLLHMVARKAIELYIDAQHECTDLAECQNAAALEVVDMFTPEQPSALEIELERPITAEEFSAFHREHLASISGGTTRIYTDFVIWLQWQLRMSRDLLRMAHDHSNLAQEDTPVAEAVRYHLNGWVVNVPEKEGTLI